MADAYTWQLYYRQVATLRECDYLPDPDELEGRIALHDTLKAIGVHPRLIGSVMVHGVPTLAVVLRMIKRYGPEETWHRCEPFVDYRE